MKKLLLLSLLFLAACPKMRLEDGTIGKCEAICKEKNTTMEDAGYDQNGKPTCLCKE